MSKIDKIRKLSEKINANIDQLNQEIEANFQDALRELMSEAPEGIKSVSWNQYTPYFMDGDTCVFSVNADLWSLYVNGIWWEDFIFEDEKTDVTVSEEEALELEEAYSSFLNKFSSFIYSIPSNTLLLMYGDHSLVTVLRDGSIEVDEYLHD